MALLNTIDNFTGAYRREGLNIVKLQGKQYLTRGFRTAEHRSSQNDNSDLEVIEDFSSISFNDDIESAKQDQLVGISGDKIYMFSDSSVTSRDIGNIHAVSASGDIFPVDKPGINTTTNNNIFYTNAAYLGCAYLFKATSASATSLVVSGETFNTTYGIDDDSYNSKIYNITKGEAYTNTTATPTDTLGFSAATTTPEADDVFMVFVDNAFSFGTPLDKGNHFASQDFPYLWARPIKLSNNHYYILNGNYIARIDVSDNDATNSTMDETWQRLYRGRQALCFDMNRENILVGTEFRGSYELFLYNEYSFGALNSISLPAEPKSIIAYESGWLVLSGATLYYTNGSSLKELSALPDLEDGDSFANMSIKGMSYKGDDVFISTSSISDRYGSGIFVYNFKNGWSFTPLGDDEGSHRGDIDTGAIINYKNTIYAGYKTDNGSNNYVLGELYNSSGDKKKIGLLFHFQEQTAIKQVGITLSEIYDELAGRRETDVTVNYGNTRRPLHQTNLNLSDNNSANTLYPTSGLSYKANIGQKVLLTSGNIAGESTYITDINNEGTSSERWTISPLLSTLPSDSSKIIKYNLYKAGTKTIDVNNIPQDIRFSTNFVGDIMYLEIELENGYLDISNIKLYG